MSGLQRKEEVSPGSGTEWESSEEKQVIVEEEGRGAGHLRKKV